MFTKDEIRAIYELHHAAGNAESINNAFNACQKELRQANLTVAMDDRAERLVTAIMKYVLESGNLTP